MLGPPMRIGENCPSRSRYKVTPDVLSEIRSLLDNVDGPAPFVVYSGDTIRKEMAGGSDASSTCLVYYINKIIKEDPTLSSYKIRAHKSGDDVMFSLEE